jgi:hypothetical protein
LQTIKEIAERGSCKMENEMRERNSLKEQKEYAWNYFQLHAGQRMTTFNFFIVISALLTTALVNSINEEECGHLSCIVGVAISISLCVVAFVFCKLDRRVSFLIKHAEKALKSFENENQKNESDIEQVYALFSTEEKQTNSIRRKKTFCFWRRHLTFKDCFNIIYYVVFSIGGIGLICFIAKFLFIISRSNTTAT